MKDLTKHWYFLDEIFSRAPLYSVDDYDAGDPCKVLADQRFRNALYLASPVFYRELEKLGFDYLRLDEKMRLSLLKYFNRCCFRATPFGAFASFGLSKWKAENIPPPDREEKLLLHLLPSRELLVKSAAIAAPAMNDIAMMNPVLYLLGKEYRYVYSGRSDRRVTFSLNSLPADDILSKLESFLSSGAKNLEEIREKLAVLAGCDVEEAGDYLNFLLEEQVLLTRRSAGPLEEDGPQPVGADFWQSWRQTTFASGFPLPEAIHNLEKTLDPESKLHQQNYFYAALERRGIRTGIDPADHDRIRDACHVLAKLSMPVINPRLQSFVKEFKARFDRQKVPLLQALDPDAGIRYDEGLRDAGVSVLLDGITFPVKETVAAAPSWSATHQLFLQRWLQESRREPFEAIRIDDEDLSTIAAPPDASRPPSQSVIFRKTSQGIFIESAGGATATALIGRFSIFSPDVYDLCRRITRLESDANPEVIFAELLQSSDDHVDNVNRRRQIYDHVIPVNCFTSRAETAKLTPQDLLVSVQGEELVLESRSLGKRVIPRLPTAYNYHHNELALFRFLADLQFQQFAADLSLDLERLFPGLPFYPRVAYKNVILCPARWLFTNDDLADLRRKPHSLGQMHRFLRKQGVPEQVCMGQGDQQLVFNLSNDREAHFFLELLRNKKTLRLEEFLGTDQAHGKHTQKKAAQCIAFIINPEPVFSPLQIMPYSPEKPRKFPLGSDWLYLKLYCTPRSSDQLLRDVVAPLVDRFRPRLRAWFFIRYVDEGYHLRLRFQGKEQDLPKIMAYFGGLVRQVAEPLVKDYQGATYLREIERYSAEQIELAELCFQAGSECILDLLTDAGSSQQITTDELNIFPMVWLMAGQFVESKALLRSFFEHMAKNFLMSFPAEKGFKVDLDKKYRELRKELQHMLEREALGKIAAGAWMQGLIKSVKDISDSTSGWNTERRLALLADLIHMQVNRFFRSGQLSYETAIYYCLHKYCSQPS